MSEFKRVGRFEVVSYNQFKAGFDNQSDEVLKSYYNGIKLPARATRGSAGYDFFAPFDITLAPGETVKVP